MSLELHSEIPPLAAEWDGLADRLNATPFLRPGWHGAWRAAFGRGALEVHALRREGRLAAVLPLERRALGLTSPTNWHTPVFDLLAEDSQAACELAEGVLARSRQPVAIAFVDEGSHAHEALMEAAGAAGRLTTERAKLRSLYVPLGGGIEAYEKRFTSKRRSRLRALRRNLEKEGALEIEVLDGQERLDPLLDEGFAVEAAAWKGSSGTAITSDAATRRFYADVARWGAARGILRLAFLRLDGRALAFDLSFEDAGQHLLIKTGYDPEHRRLAPGVVLRIEMLRRAFEAGLSTYEFLGGDDGWKLEWGEHWHHRREVRVFPRNPVGLGGFAAERWGRRIVMRGLQESRRLSSRVSERAEHPGSR